MLANQYRSPWITPDVEAFRGAADRFWRTELLPHAPRWEEQGFVDRSVWNRMGELGLLLADIPSEYGGGDGSYAHLATLVEVAAAHGLGLGFGPHYIVAHYLLAYGSETQKRNWLPAMTYGDLVASIGMSEPGAGSDLAGIKTRAVREGDHYVIDGSKTFNTNGHHADLVLLAAKTDPAAGAKGISLFIVDVRNLPGFKRGRLLEKVGLQVQDTTELFFDGMRIPADSLLGGHEGIGFGQMMEQLAYERTLIAVRSIATAERAIALTLEHVKSRQAFGSPLLKLQNTRFELAEMKTETFIGRIFIDQCIQWQLNKQLDVATAAMSKWWGTHKECEVVDRCLQLFGGYGFMREFPIARMYMDSRVQKIYGGANEVMKEIIARQL